jgi:L-histidine Nalpha-methyltransferase
MQHEDKLMQPGIQRTVKRGLENNRKYLPEWLLLDQTGQELAFEISQLPEYYPSACAAEMYSLYGYAIACNFRQESRSWNFIDWIDHPTREGFSFLSACRKAGIELFYYPVATSETVTLQAGKLVEEGLPGVVHSMAYAALTEPLSYLPTKNFPTIYFLGDGAGNVDTNDLSVALKAISMKMKRKDRVILNLDLMKSPSVIEKAYHDYTGVNTLYHKNVLARINREMQSNFDLRQFEYWPIYDAVAGTCRKYLVSLTEQKVTFPKDNFTAMFKPWETIAVGLSQKYNEESTRELIAMSGLAVEKMLYDSRRYYTLMILKSV